MLWHCWLGHLTRRIVSEMTYNVSSVTLNTTIPYHLCECCGNSVFVMMKYQCRHGTVCHQRLWPAAHFWHFGGRPSLIFAVSHTADLALSIRPSASVYIELYNSFVYKLYKVLPGLCDGSTIILTFLVVVVVVVVVNDVSFSVSGWVFISTINSRPTCEQQWMSRRMEAPAIFGVTRWCTQLHWR